MKQIRKILSMLLFVMLLAQSALGLVSCNDGDECQHAAWSDWTVTQEATCTVEGVRTRTCMGCSKTDTETIAVTSHSFTKYVSDGNASCISNATETATCDNCTATDTREIANSKNASVHASDEIHYHKNATDATKHDKHYACCGAVIETQAHVWDGGVVEGDVTVYTCTLCKTTNRVPSAEHAHAAVFVAAKAASCTEAGNVAYWYCEGCRTYFADEALTQQLTLGETVIAAAHTSTEFTYSLNPADATKHDKKHACCGAVIETQAHVWDGGVADGDVTVYTCTLCRTTNRVNPAGHTHAAAFVAAKAASCTEAGNVAHWYCEGCHTYFADEALTQQLMPSDIVIAAAHTSADFIYSVNPTDATKHDKKHACCGSLVESVAHTFEFHRNLIPQCDQTGGEEHKCVCGETVIKNETAATGHSVEFWNFVSETAKAGAECTFVQTYEGTCFTCNKPQTKTTEVVRHRFIATVTSHPTCSSTGTKSYECACGAKPATPTLTIPATPNAHDWDDGVSAGGVTTYECRTCTATKTALVSDSTDMTVNASDLDGNDLVLDGVSLRLDSTTLSLLDGEVNINASPVTDRAALIATLPEALRGQITQNTPVYDFALSSNGQPIRNFDGGSINITIPYVLPTGVDADCIAIWYVDDNGEVSFYRATYYEVNGEGFVSFDAAHFSTYLPGLAPEEDACELYEHNEVSLTVAPTCTESGYTEYHCQRCGNSRIADTVAPLGHAYDSGVSTDATCSVPGTTTYTCTRNNCRHQTVVALSVPHDYRYDGEASNPATCTTDGYVIYTCANCSAQKREEQTARGSHDMEVIGVELATGSSSCTDGVVLSKRCYVCGDTETETIYEHTPYDKYTDEEGNYLIPGETEIDLGEYLTQAGIQYQESPVITIVHGCLCGAKKSEIRMSNGMGMYGSELFMGAGENSFMWHSAPMTPDECDTILMQTQPEMMYDPMTGPVEGPVFSVQFKEILTIDRCHYTYSVEIKIGYNESTGEALRTETYVLSEFDFHLEQSTATVKDPSKSCYENCFDENGRYTYGITVTVTCKNCGDTIRTYEEAVSSSSSHFWYSTGESYRFTADNCSEHSYVNVSIQRCPCGMERYTLLHGGYYSTFTSQTVDGATVYTCRDCGFIYAEKTVDVDDRDNCHRTRTNYLWIGCAGTDDLTNCEKSFACVSIDEVVHYSQRQDITTEPTDDACCVHKYLTTVCSTCGEEIRSSNYYENVHDILTTEVTDSHGNVTVTESCKVDGCDYLHITVTDKDGFMLREYTVDKNYGKGEKTVDLSTWKILWGTVRPMIERMEYYDLETGELVRWYQTNYTYESVPNEGCFMTSTFMNHEGSGDSSTQEWLCEFGEIEHQDRTCLQDGYDRHTCTRCGFVEYMFYEQAEHYFNYEYAYKTDGGSISYCRCSMCGIIVTDMYALGSLEIMNTSEGGDTATVKYLNPEGSEEEGIDATVSFVAYAINEWNEILTDENTFELITLTLSVEVTDDGEGTLSFLYDDVANALNDTVVNDEYLYAVCLVIEADGQNPIYIQIQ